MAKKAKDIRPIITLECTEQKATGVPGISRYTTEKVRTFFARRKFNRSESRRADDMRCLCRTAATPRGALSS